MVCSVGLLGALRSLRDGLRALGSDLIIRAGSTQKLLPELARHVHARQVIIEEEVEHRSVPLLHPEILSHFSMRFTSTLLVLSKFIVCSITAPKS